MFELLPPQRAALLEQGLLDPAKTAIVIDLPTSGGKTLLAQFRILQALLNQVRCRERLDCLRGADARPCVRRSPAG